VGGDGLSLRKPPIVTLELGVTRGLRLEVNKILKRREKSGRAENSLKRERQRSAKRAASKKGGRASWNVG